MRFEGGTASRLLTGGFIASALVCGAWLGLNQMMGAASGLDRIENLTLDWRFLLAGARPAPPGVVIVAIDDQTLSEAEVHAVSRGTLARLVRAIVDFHPQAVALDIAFPDSKGEKEDAELADALRSTRSVVASIGIFDLGEPSGGRSHSDQSARSGDLAFAPEPSEVLWPTDAIRDATQNGARQCIDGFKRNPTIRSDDFSNPRWRGAIFRVGHRVGLGWS
jgi:adenylate cyclase